MFEYFPIAQDLYSRPSTPIEEVLRHSYGDKWVESMQNKQANIKQDKTDSTVIKKTTIDYKLIYLIYYFLLSIRLLLHVVIIQKHHFFVKLKFLLNQNHYGKCLNLLM